LNVASSFSLSSSEQMFITPPGMQQFFMLAVA
jgi:hypothetical protein